MVGKKIRVFYHGMKRQCNGCFSLGHMKWECQNKPVNWMGYVHTLRDSGKFEKEMFGDWLVEKKTAEKTNKGEDLRDLLRNPDKLKRALQSFLGGEESRRMSNDMSQDEEEGSGRKRERNQGRSNAPRNQQRRHGNGNQSRGGRNYNNEETNNKKYNGGNGRGRRN